MKLRRYGQEIESLGQRYRLEGLLGGGAVADVCEAWDEVEGRTVAIKLMKSDDIDQELLDSFLNEARQVAGWEHPHILRVFDEAQLELLDPASGICVPYIVMELAEGGDLQKRLRFGLPHPLPETMLYFAQLCSAVQFAHEHGVIHGDIKPLNILFRELPDGTEQLVLGDFGMAMQYEAMGYSYSRAGTLAYMAPEQFDDRLSKASDIYALGVVLYQMCTGRLPYKRSIRDLQHREAQMPPPRPGVLQSRIPPALDAVIMQALSEDPGQRLPSAARFWEAVHAAVKHMPEFAMDVSDELADDPEPRGAVREIDTPNRRERPRTMRDFRTRNLAEAAGAGAIADLAAKESSAESDPSPIRFTKPDGRPRPRPASQSLRPSNRPSGGRETPLTPPGRSSRPASRPPSRPASRPPSRPARPTRNLSEFSDEQPVLPPERQKFPSRPLDRNMAAANRRPRPATGGLGAGGSRPVIKSGSSAAPDDPTIISLKPGSRPPTSRPEPPEKKRRSLLMLILGILIVLLLLFGIYNALGLPNPFGGLPPDTSQITLKPASLPFKHDYTIQASTNPISGQIGARFLSSSLSQNKTVAATGAGNIQGKSSHGNLTFFNGNFQAKTVGAGTVITGKSGVSVVTEQDANIPAAIVGQQGKTVVPAHAVNAGANGNIPAGDISKACCQTNVAVQNKAFTGGVDAQTFTFVQQSDINGAITSLKPGLIAGAQNGVKTQLNPGEKLAGDTQCKTTQANSDQNAGDHANNVTVNVSERCTNEAFNQDAAQNMAKQQFVKDATNGFKLVGAISSTLVSSTPDAGGQGGITLKYALSGTRVYQFTLQQQQALARLIAGKTKEQATGILLQQTGVAGVEILLSQSNGDTLPRDPNRITIAVQDVQ